jgi:hypothetical protein
MTRLTCLQARALNTLSDVEILHLVRTGHLSPHRLEQDLGDTTRAAGVRRAYIVEEMQRQQLPHAQKAADAMNRVPIGAFDTKSFYNSILNTNCEAVIGYV